MDTELFMECEEEELEPWQQVDDGVEEDDEALIGSYCEPLEDSLSPPPAPETPPSKTPFPATVAPAAMPPLQVQPPAKAPPPAPTFITTVTPAPSAPPVRAQAPPLILTQTAGGTFLVPAASGSSASQPFLLTTQGFRVPAMVNPGAPLVLNLQPGQNLQPLTLIQSPPLGQLVQPGVGVSSVMSQKQPRTGPVPSGGPGTFTAMQLPTTLTIRTSTSGPVNLQMAQVSSAKPLGVSGSSILQSASSNGVIKVVPVSRSSDKLLASGHLPSVVMTPSVTMATASGPPRVVMSVEDFYYGRLSGDVSKRKLPPEGAKVWVFTCSICSYRTKNNLRLMEHMLQHSDMVRAGRNHQCCRFCFRQFLSPALLKEHHEQVHGSARSTCVCRICEWSFENEPAFLNHMKYNHKPGEMPYDCQVCSYRSSFYADILQHFATFHKDSSSLLCIFCLKVSKNPSSYQQHMIRHKMNQGFHCNRCRLQFISVQSKMQHKLEAHRSFRKPPQLDGLPPGSKVTIRTYGSVKSLSAPKIQNIKIKTEPERLPIQKNPTVIKSLKPLSRRPQSRRERRSSSCDLERLLCLECGTDASDLSAHYPTYVHCLLCAYGSCCSRAYAAHMIHHHVPGAKDKVLPLHRRAPPCAFLLRCSGCDFQPQSADMMADHLLLNPEHQSALCWSREYSEPDIQLNHNEEEPCSAEPQGPPEEPQGPSWRSAESWTEPLPGSSCAVLPFTEFCGPRHSLSRHCDAMDFFNLLFPASLVELVTKETNAHAKTCRALGFGPKDWAPVTALEIKSFIGLVILIGLHNLSDLSHYWSFNHYDNSYTFHRAMSISRFKQIAANIRMGNLMSTELCGAGRPGDPLCAFRPMLDILGGAMWSAYRPNCCLTIDRALLPSLEGAESCSRGSSTQPQVWLLCDSKSGYCHRFFIQLSPKPGQDLGLTVVPELLRDLDNKHHQLFLANSLTSVPLMQKLLEQGVYASSSFPPPSPILPRALWEGGRLDRPGDFLQRQLGPLIATRWRDTKEMGCLSTNAPAGEPDSVYRRSTSKVGGLVTISRPMAFRLLQENMRGVDICKQLLACNPLGGIPQDRHWRNLFWFLVNLSIINAFIVLRESRKENPPAWVQDGLFSQVNFRKRLGNQLARCAHKSFEPVENTASHGPKGEELEEPAKQRHRLAKISRVSKRCRNCSSRNLRQESTYGCVACKVNLCKEPSCFWEFHRLSPLNKGSARIGFLKDQLSGAVEVEELPDNVDEAMAPVEDLDSSDNENEDVDDLEDVEELDALQREDMSAAVPSETPSVETQSQAAPAGGAELSAHQLRVSLLALCEGLHEASRVHSTNAQLIQSWLRTVRRHLKQSAVRCEGSDRMASWVLSTREQQLPLTESALFHRATVLKRKGAFHSSFRLSFDWAVKFLLRHRLAYSSRGRGPSLDHVLPPSIEIKVHSFRDFAQRVLQQNQLGDASVAAMDELCLFVDFGLAQDEARRSEALGLTGAVPDVTVYLAVLADGALLPALVLTSRQLPEKTFPEPVLLEVSPEGRAPEDNLDMWASKVWLKHLSGSTQPKKSLLVLDRHREHTADHFLSTMSGAQSLPAVIPEGCSFCLQPLEVCLKPALQRYLLVRWAEFTAQNPPELKETTPPLLQATAAQLLVDWLGEALSRLRQLHHLWRKSFQLTGILKASEDTEDQRKPEDIQKDLLRIATEALLGPESTDTDPELQELLEQEDIPGDELDSKAEDMEEDETKEEAEGQDTETGVVDNKMDEGQREEHQEDKKEGQRDDKQEDKKKEGQSEDQQEDKKEEQREDNHQDREKKIDEATEDKLKQRMETDECEMIENKEEMMVDRKEDLKEDRKEERLEDMMEDRKKRMEESKEDRTEDLIKDRKDMMEDRTEDFIKDRKEDRKEDTVDDRKEDLMENRKEDLMEDSEEDEGQTRKEEDKEWSKERRETRIVIGEEVGDEWKITVQTRADAARADGAES